VCDAGPEVAQASADSPAWNWKAFNATSAVLFLAELGDKTQLAVLGLSSSASSPWAIFAGGTLALTVVTGLGVLGGQQLCRMIPQRILLQISAGLFMLLACLMALGII
jgi:putative Ca2+/H+ antiporter (TMEM165/GDT1 family)